MCFAGVGTFDRESSVNFFGGDIQFDGVSLIRIQTQHTFI